MASFLAAEDVVHVKDVVAIFIVITIVFDALARFRQYAPRIPRRFIFECGVAYPISRRKVGCQSL